MWMSILSFLVFPPSQPTQFPTVPHDTVARAEEIVLFRAFPDPLTPLSPKVKVWSLEPMSKRNLFICFDAFGTLFAPKRPVAKQYGEVARAFGLSGFTDNELQDSFKAAFKQEAREHPNYGKASGMNAEGWWTNIIRNTFQPLVGESEQLPAGLTPTLLHRFWSDEGYVLLPGVQDVLHQLKTRRNVSDGAETVVGVITNSDDRVPDILSSLGLYVSPLRYKSKPQRPLSSNAQYDIEMTIMSFDVGHEKPDTRIFAAAEEMLETALACRPRISRSAASDAWAKVYVGDEYTKDIQGAMSAGWNAILVGPPDVSKHEKVVWLEEQVPQDLFHVFDTNKAIGIDSLSKLGKWVL